MHDLQMMLAYVYKIGHKLYLVAAYKIGTSNINDRCIHILE